MFNYFCLMGNTPRPYSLESIHWCGSSYCGELKMQRPPIILSSRIHPTLGLVQRCVCSVGIWECGLVTSRLPCLVLWLLLSGIPPRWVCQAAYVCSETGVFPQWCGKSVHHLCWAFVPFRSPQIGGLQQDLLCVLCVCWSYLRVTWTGTPSYQYFPCLVSGSTIIFPGNNAPSLCGFSGMCPFRIVC